MAPDPGTVLPLLQTLLPQIVAAHVTFLQVFSSLLSAAASASSTTFAPTTNSPTAPAPAPASAQCTISLFDALFVSAEVCTTAVSARSTPLPTHSTSMDLRVSTSIVDRNQVVLLHPESCKPTCNLCADAPPAPGGDLCSVTTNQGQDMQGSKFKMPRAKFDPKTKMHVDEFLDAPVLTSSVRVVPDVHEVTPPVDDNEKFKPTESKGHDPTEEDYDREELDHVVFSAHWQALHPQYAAPPVSDPGNGEWIILEVNQRCFEHFKGITVGPDVGDAMLDALMNVAMDLD